MPTLEVRNWFETKREGVVMLKVSVTNKQKSKVKVSIGFEVEDEASLNVRLPKSLFKDKFVDNDTKCFMHLQKIDITNPEWGKFKIVVKSKEVEASGIPKPPPLINNAGISTYPFMISRVGYATMGYGGNIMHHAPQDSVTVKC
jgi:hypothetical protein